MEAPISGLGYWRFFNGKTMKKIIPHAVLFFYLSFASVFPAYTQISGDCSLQNPVKLNRDLLSEDNAVRLLKEFQPSFSPAQMQQILTGVEQCNTQVEQALQRIETARSDLSLILQEVHRYKDISTLNNRIKTLESSRKESIAELERNLAAIRQLGLFVTYLPVSSVYEGQEDLRNKAQKIMARRAISDLIGEYIIRTTSVVGLQEVRDVITSFKSGSMEAGTEVQDIRNNIEKYYLLLGEVSVVPEKLEAQQSNQGTLPASLTVNLLSESYAILKEKKVSTEHLETIRSFTSERKNKVIQINEQSRGRRENLISAGESKIRQLDEDIRLVKKDLESRKNEERMLLDKINAKYFQNKPAKTLLEAEAALLQKAKDLTAGWKEIKSQEIKFVNTRVTLEGDPVKDLAGEVLKLRNKIEQQYGITQQIQEQMVIINQTEIQSEINKKESVSRRVRTAWLYPVAQEDNSINLHLLANFDLFDDDTPKIPSKMVLIPGGSFRWSPDGKSNQPVAVADFYLSKMEVTFAEYDDFCTETGCVKPGDERWGRGNRPVINISWYDAVAFCNWKSSKEGLTPCYTIKAEIVTCNWKANGYRLPTEAEWEYAAREGGRKVRFGNGQEIADARFINFDASRSSDISSTGTYRGKTVPVGTLNKPNALGLHDMSGNVWEWCWDWYSQDVPATENPKGPATGTRKVYRGGSWFQPASYATTDRREAEIPNRTMHHIGFRIARNK